MSFSLSQNVKLNRDVKMNITRYPLFSETLRGQVCLVTLEVSSLVFRKSCSDRVAIYIVSSVHLFSTCPFRCRKSQWNFRCCKLHVFLDQRSPQHFWRWCVT